VAAAFLLKLVVNVMIATIKKQALKKKKEEWQPSATPNFSHKFMALL